MRLTMTLNETWSVARDQSRLGGSVPRLTRKTFSCACSEEGAQDDSARNTPSASVVALYGRLGVRNVEAKKK